MMEPLVEKLMSQEVLLEQMKIIFEVMKGKIDNKFLAVALYKPIANSITKYYNLIYESLVNNNDKIIREKFNELMVSGHKEMCLISVMFHLSMAFLHQIMENHHLLNKHSCDEYIADIDELFFLNLEHYKKSVMEVLKHVNTSGKCPGKELKDCDSTIAPFPVEI